MSDASMHPAVVQGDLFGKDRRYAARRIGFMQVVFGGIPLPLGEDELRQNVLLGRISAEEAYGGREEAP